MTKHLQPTPQAARRELPIAQSIGLVSQPVVSRERTRFPFGSALLRSKRPLVGTRWEAFVPAGSLARSANPARLTKGFRSSLVRLTPRQGGYHD